MFDTECFHPNLQGTLTDKRALFQDVDHKLWMYVDGVLAGETFGCRLSNILTWDVIQGSDYLRVNKDKTLYIHSTAIRPQFQGQGLSKILKAYSLGLVKKEYKTVIGHARHGASINLSLTYGAKIKMQFDDWYGTGETYYLYQLDLWR
jgi:predicted GNAT family acetyltransferase